MLRPLELELVLVLCHPSRERQRAVIEALETKNILGLYLGGIDYSSLPLNRVLLTYHSLLRWKNVFEKEDEKDRLRLHSVRDERSEGNNNNSELVKTR